MPSDVFEFWIDRNLPRSLIYTIQRNSNCLAVSFSDLNLEETDDITIYNLASKKSNVVIITKDKDFVDLLQAKGTPPKILWITVGNVKNIVLKQILEKSFQMALDKLMHYDIVEISNSL